MTNQDEVLITPFTSIQMKNKARNKQRLSTLKLWQRHIEVLSEPQPTQKRPQKLKTYDDFDVFKKTSKIQKLKNSNIKKAIH